MKYTTILFDLDGTLLDFARTEEKAFELAFEKLGIPSSRAIYERYSAINDELWKSFERKEITKDEIGKLRFSKLFAEEGINADGVACNEIFKEFVSQSDYKFDGVDEMLNELICKGHQLYAVTNGTEWIQQRRLANTGLDKLFKGVFVSEKIGKQKPEREYFDYVFANIEEKDKQKILIVGDSLTSDIQGGINAKIDCCYFGTKQAATIQPTYCVTNFDEMISVITQK